MAGRVDVLVAGSGAAGLTAALACAAGGLRPLVCEASALLGGTSALSGGRVWVPGNRFQPEPAADLDAAARYLDGLFDRRYAGLTEAFLATAPAMADFVEARTRHRFVPCGGYPDYHPERPGGTLGGRCLDAAPCPLATLDPVADLVRRPPGYLPLTHADWERWRFPPDYDLDLLHHRDTERIATGGVALVSALVDGVVRAGGRVRTGERLVALTLTASGSWRATLRTTLRTTGGQRSHRTKPAGPAEHTVLAGRVVLATGGFDQDPELRRRYLPAGVVASAAGPSNVGDALGLCEELGAQLEDLDQGWWMPVLAVPGERVDGVPAYRSLVRERGAPRQIVVDRTGHRFTDEAAPYHDFGRALQRHAEAFQILDEGHRRCYGLPGAGAGEPVPEWVARADTLDGLAAGTGVDPVGLADQVERWNGGCARGSDGEFGRGGNAYDRYYGDPARPGNPNLGPIDRPPYYGIRVLAGTIGSKGGPVTDPDGRVLDRAGRPVPGLFAAGNAAAFWTADGYPGPGATLGTGMTIGFRAGRAIVAARDPEGSVQA